MNKFDEGLELFDNKNFEDARLLFLSCIRDKENSDASCLYTALVYIHFEDYVTAIIYLEKIVNLDGIKNIYYYENAICYKKIGNNTKAISFFHKAILVDQSDFKSINGFNELIIKKAYQLFDEDEYAEAMNLYNKVIVHENNIDFIKYWLALCYKCLNDYSNAVKEFRQIVAIETFEDDYYYELGSCYMELENYKKALICFNTAAAINDKNEEYKIQIYYLIDRLKKY